MCEGLTDKIKALEHAQDATRACLDNANVLVDMHGLEYWAGRVERLREEIKKAL